MTDFFAARSQMALSLAFHMVFATAGIGMPMLMLIAEGLGMKTGNPVWNQLAKKWAKATAILFAVGAVSGTVLSFELGLLWPGFMEFAGPIIGMPFSLEGFAFFFEAIFLGLYLYGWKKIPPLGHWFTGLGVLVCGTLSGAFVVCANAWMNTPAGFTLDESGNILSVDPWAAMFNPSSFGQALHMTVAAFLATGFAAAALHAWMLLKRPNDDFHRRGLALALTVGFVFTALQPITGHVIGEAVAHHQPVKFAALEGHWETQTQASFIVGGWPDEAAEETRWGLEIPYLLSFMAFSDFDAEVMGLKDVDPEDRPPVLVTRMAYQLMLFTMVYMGAVTFLGMALLIWKRRVPLNRWYLMLLVSNGPMGIIGIEAGWTATEVGRQPWVIYNVMRTADAVTPMPGLVVPFTVMTILYLVLSVLTVMLLRRQFMHSPTLDVREDSIES